MRPLALALPLLAACGTETLSQSWQLDRLRVLAVRAEPAEPRPGETVRFTSLIYTPYGVELGTTIWFACLPSAADDYGCTLDPELQEALEGDMEDLTPEEQAELFQQAREAGLIGVEPALEPVWTAPADALDGLDEQAALEGVSAVVNVTAIPEGAETDADVELAYKRLPISLSEAPNTNPGVPGVLVTAARGGADVAPGADGVYRIEAGATYEITPLLEEGAVEDYVYVNSDGVAEERTEEPYFTWYAEGGSFDQPYTLHPHLSVEWTAPDQGFEGLVAAVVRDRRGGMGWTSIRVSTAAE